MALQMEVATNPTGAIQRAIPACEKRLEAVYPRCTECGSTWVEEYWWMFRCRRCHVNFTGEITYQEASL